MRGDKMCMEIVRRVGGVRLLLKRPFLEPMNEGNMRGLTEEAERRGGETKEGEMRSLLMSPCRGLPAHKGRDM
jgi:hypothetical protein